MPGRRLRADRDDDEYAELATRYPSAISLGLGQGEGVLVAPRWVLTAAHRAVVFRDLKPRPALAIGAGRYEIEAVVLHPDWKGSRDNDVALLQLATAVTDVAPAALQHTTDEACSSSNSRAIRSQRTAADPPEIVPVITSTGSCDPVPGGGGSSAFPFVVHR